MGAAIPNDEPRPVEKTSFQEVVRSFCFGKIYITEFPLLGFSVSSTPCFHDVASLPSSQAERELCTWTQHWAHE